jgi:hypothetical protein
VPGPTTILPARSSKSTTTTTTWMKSLLLRRLTLVETSVRSWRAPLASSNVLRYPGRDLRLRLTKHESYSTSPTHPTNSEDVQPLPLQNSSVAAEEDTEAEKPKRRTRSSSQKETEPLPQLPSSLNILWAPHYESNRIESPQSATIPPDFVFDEVLENLQVTLHPQIQHRATYSSAAGPPVEPTFALYCPIEGGDYIIDETVYELARKTGSDVVVLDAVQLAAGESGQFGKGMTCV